MVRPPARSDRVDLALSRQECSSVEPTGIIGDHPC